MSCLRSVDKLAKLQEELKEKEDPIQSQVKQGDNALGCQVDRSYDGRASPPQKKICQS